MLTHLIHYVILVWLSFLAFFAVAVVTADKNSGCNRGSDSCHFIVLSGSQFVRLLLGLVGDENHRTVGTYVASVHLRFRMAVPR